VADTVRLNVESVGLTDLYRDLQACAGGLEHELTSVLRDGAQRIADRAREIGPRGAASWAGSSGERLPRIRDSYFAASAELSATVRSLHPAAQVWEWGGQIAPRVPGGAKVARVRDPRALISIPRLAPVHHAAELELPALERDLQAAVDRLLASYHL
jgi:hypothetical protein